jgi:hypothetical protein
MKSKDPLAEYREHMKKFYSGNYVFDQAKYIIKNGFDLDLTTIEYAKLRFHCALTLNELLQIEGIKNMFDPSHDAVARFLHYEYGIPTNDTSMIKLLVRKIRDKEFNKYLKILQDRMHFSVY